MAKYTVTIYREYEFVLDVDAKDEQEAKEKAAAEMDDGHCIDVTVLCEPAEDERRVEV